MQNKLFSGVYTAIITPFTENNLIDYESLDNLIEFNIKNGVNGIVSCGTTGESPTLEFEEQQELIKKTIEFVDGRVKVIAGTGSNSTSHAIKLSKMAEKLGVDALLLVNPYYNKPTQEGLYLHFKAISDAVNIPCILYNIKGRTGVNLETKTLLRLINDCKNIIAVKEASGDLDQIKEVINSVPSYFSVLSGDDGLTLELIKYGGDGVISVASNFMPNEIVNLVKYSLNKDYINADQLNENLKEFFKLNFIETNPIPIKYMLSKIGLCNEIYRLPLCSLSNGSKKIIDDFLFSNV
jgi:4-hydroxy-tetrahydrodipicolinate synthase